MGRSRWGTCPLRWPRPIRACSPTCAASGCRCGSQPCRSFPTPTNAEAEGACMTTLYTADHEWLRIDGDIATIGVTDYAQSQLGDVVFVELPKVGRALKKAEA